MSMFEKRVEAGARVLQERLFPGVDLPLSGESAWVAHVREVLVAADAVVTEEQIARALDPDSWRLKDDPRYKHLPPEAGQSVVRKSLEQARAVVALFHGGESNEHNRA